VLHNSFPRRLRLKSIPIAALVLLVSAGSLFAQPAARNPRRERAIEQELAAIAPAAVPIFQNGTRAMDSGDYATAVGFYREALKLAPNSPAVLRRLGTCLVSNGGVDEGRGYLEQAVARQRSPENLISLASALAFRRTGEPAPQTDRETRARTGERGGLEVPRYRRFRIPAGARADCSVAREVTRLQARDGCAREDISG